MSHSVICYNEAESCVRGREGCPTSVHPSDAVSFSLLLAGHYAACAGSVAEHLTASSSESAKLSHVSDGVKDVMLAMQQMASVAVQMNAARDPCHNGLLQSLSPDALLACGELFECGTAVSLYASVRCTKLGFALHYKASRESKTTSTQHHCSLDSPQHQLLSRD